MEAIADEANRFNQIESVARQWLESDRTAALAWLARVNLPEDRKKGLLNRP